MNEPKNDWYSAEDLPMVQELRWQLKISKAIRNLVAPLDCSTVQSVKEDPWAIEERLNELVNLVDAFYDLLGSRHWIFTNFLNLDIAREIVKAQSPEEAEQQIIEYYQTESTLNLALVQLRRQPAMEARLPLIHYALDDYRAGRYYSTVHILISVMDGFVNDCNPEQRKDMSARNEEEMTGEDGAAALSRGLPKSHEMFRKGFRKLSDKEVTEVYRNGIVHGMLTNYNNVLVATKAWNMLFAVFDWKESRDAKNKREQEQTPSLTEMLKRLRHLEDNRKKLEQWKPYQIDVNNPDSDKSGAYRACADFLTAWGKKNYGQLGEFLYNRRGDSKNKKAKEAKDLYSATSLSAWKILKADRPAAAVALFDVQLECDRFQETKQLRFARVKSQDDMDTATDWEAGCWVLVGGYATIPEPSVPQRHRPA